MASKFAASEDAIAKLHAKVTKIFGMSLDQMIEKLDNDEPHEFCVDPKLMNTVLKFISDNKVFALAAEDVKDNPLAVKLAQIRSRGAAVVPLVAKEG